MEMIGGLAGAAGSIVSGILGARAANKAANINWQINLMNYMQREREREEARQLTNELRDEQKLGGSDIRGTRTQWIPGKGWVVTAAPAVQKMMDLQDQAQQDILTKDIPMRRKVMERNYVRGLGEEALADMFKRELGNVRMGTDEGIAADYYNAQTFGLRKAMQDASSQAYTQAARTGQNSNFPLIARQLAKQQTDAYDAAALQSRMAARGTARKEYDQQRAGLANLYSMFATRAGQVPDVNYKPVSFGEGSTDDMSKLLAGANAAGVQANMMKGGTLDYIQPNYGMANAVGGGASALASALRMGGASMRRGSGAAGGGYSDGGVTGFGGSGDEGYNAGNQAIIANIMKGINDYSGGDMYLSSEGGSGAP